MALPSKYNDSILQPWKRRTRAKSYVGIKGNNFKCDNSISAMHNAEDLLSFIRLLIGVHTI
ncbi:hypothetical protein Syun_029580 [Stephania yunnanensis]|uniref:Uncharacterized protein n=1 Tax=Stephania yunnanensis TaxID=152371 RepID=A0AAP0E5W3_9MAGN